ncbi:RNA-binding protein [Methanomicrobiaceae archaeon CYW5]|uniref:RNA-binding protein n=1 Tax=Methanovulcanius yangii TaxID=1789227 RepID=UPI0029C9E707|nr:RNA-binding protein [Methanovulcanius yangii]MBT8508367.1 RNA-binding protein [Methanovulcanius yangii]
MAKISPKKRHTIRKSKQSKIFAALREEIGESAEAYTGKSIEMVETTGETTVFLVDRHPVIMEMGEIVFPTLRGAVERPFPEKNITVDAGAIAFMAKGADVMRPGIVKISPDVKKDHPVLIIEERYGKPLAVGIALYDAEEMELCETGKVIKTIHHVGDDLWNMEI